MTTSGPAPPAGRLRRGTHVYPVRVYYEDTDAGGIVYHAGYLRFAERARTELLRCLGIEHADLLADHQVQFVVHEMQVQFHVPARLGDVLEVHTELDAMSGARVELSQSVRREGTELVALALTLACVAPGGRPRRWPPSVVAAFAGLPRR